VAKLLGELYSRYHSSQNRVYWDVEFMATRTHDRSYFPLESITIYHTVVGMD
jgi:hypothetical protein